MFIGCADGNDTYVVWGKKEPYLEHFSLGTITDRGFLIDDGDGFAADTVGDMNGDGSVSYTHLTLPTSDLV